MAKDELLQIVRGFSVVKKDNPITAFSQSPFFSSAGPLFFLSYVLGMGFLAYRGRILFWNILLVRGAHQEQGLGNNFLSHIRAVDGVFS